MARWSGIACIVAVLLCGAWLLSGCASMFGGGSNQGISISSEPSGAHFLIKSSSGLEMAQGVTPQTLQLPRKNEYQIDVTMDGYKPRTLALTKGTNVWVWANILIGGIFGLIIDFATGAAYKLEPAIVSVTLETALLDDGSQVIYAVARLLSRDGRVLEERRVLMEAVPLATDSMAVGIPH
jgi:hypothetical protein